MLLTHTMLAEIGLCQPPLDKLRDLIPQESFTAREAVDAYVSAGHDWKAIPHAYQALVNAGRIPDVGLIWHIPRIAFRNQPERNARLRRWADELGPGNWREAQSEVAADYAFRSDATDADASASNAADAAAYAAAAYADAAAGHATAYATAYAAAYADAANDATRAAAKAAGGRVDIVGIVGVGGGAYRRVKQEILDMIVEEIERN